MRSPRPNCIIDGCDRPQFSRGLCHQDSLAFRRAIKAGEITEPEAIELGLVLPKQRAGRKVERVNPWNKRLQALRLKA